jgi:hypothetical protein
MLRAIAPVLLCGMMATILACSQQDPVDNNAGSTTAVPAGAAATPAADVSGAPPVHGTTPSQTTSAENIPASLVGRWGLTPMDCTSTRGDAKGLLIVSADNLKFYESRAVPARDAHSGTDSISGNFDYSGEGQTWTKFESLELKGHGLVRTESNPVASFTYARCT